MNFARALFAFFTGFRQPRPRHLAGIEPARLGPNQLWHEFASEANLERAFVWLGEQSSAASPHSDVWDYRRNWPARRPALRRALQGEEFVFQPVRVVEVCNEQGINERIEIRAAEDRLVIRALAQVLQTVLQPRLSPRCTHLAGNGGLHQAVADTQDYLAAHPDAQVIKSDVKGYYAHIDHLILAEQLRALLPDETALHRLLWAFMRRTTEFGGNYTDIERGLPLGASLSPLLGAVYLSPLDQLAETGGGFYRRYMDDWVWFHPTRRALRQAVKAQYDVFQALRVETHPDKTYIGKAAKGFDFLGFHCCPTGVKVSDAALSRRDEKVARLYEQGASKQRIARYLVRWLGWAVLAGTSTLGHAVTYHIGTSCSAVNGTATIVDIVPMSHSMGWGTAPRDYPDGKCWIYIGGAPQIITITPAPSGGAATCSPLSPEYGDSTTCTANPDVGYAAGTWSGDCGTGSAATPCTLTNVISAKTVSATFTAIPGYVPTGPVSRIVYDPTTPTTLYSALDGGGVWKKVGAGNWTAAATQPANLKVKDLVIAAGGTTLYAGTDGGGVFKSINSGVDWAACANTGLTNLNLRSLALTGTTLYAGTEGGVFKSTDDCANWSAMNAGLPL